MPPKKTKAKAAAGDARQSDAHREYDGLGDDAGGEYGFDGYVYLYLCVSLSFLSSLPLAL